MADVDVMNIPHSANGGTGGGEPESPQSTIVDDIGIERGERVLLKPASPTVEVRPKFPGEDLVTPEVVGAAEVPINAMNGSAENFGNSNEEESRSPAEGAEQVNQVHSTGLEVDVGVEHVGTEKISTMDVPQTDSEVVIPEKEQQVRSAPVVPEVAHPIPSEPVPVATEHLDNKESTKPVGNVVDSQSEVTLPAEQKVEVSEPIKSTVDEQNLNAEPSKLSADVPAESLVSPTEQQDTQDVEDVPSKVVEVSEPVSSTVDEQNLNAEPSKLSGDISESLVSPIEQDRQEKPPVLDEDVRSKEVEVSEPVTSTVDEQNLNAEPSKLTADVPESLVSPKEQQDTQENPPVSDVEDVPSKEVDVSEPVTSTVDEQNLNAEPSKLTADVPESLISSTEQQDTQEKPPVLDVEDVPSKKVDVSEPITSTVDQQNLNAEPSKLSADVPESLVSPTEQQDTQEKPPIVEVEDIPQKEVPAEEIVAVEQGEVHAEPPVTAFESGPEELITADKQEDEHVAPEIFGSSLQSEVSEPAVVAVEQEEAHAKPQSSPMKHAEPEAQIGADRNEIVEGLQREEPPKQTEREDKVTEPNISVIEQFGEETSRQILEMGISAEKELQNAKGSSTADIDKNEMGRNEEEVVASKAAENESRVGDVLSGEEAVGVSETARATEAEAPVKKAAESEAAIPSKEEPESRVVKDTKDEVQVVEPIPSEKAEVVKEEVPIKKEAIPVEEKESDETESQQQTELDILGNGLLIKKMLVPGQGLESRPQIGDVVTMNIKGKLEDGTAVDCHEDYKFTLGDGDVVQALDLGVALMEKGEQCHLTTDSKYAFSVLGDDTVDPHIPPNAKITYDLQLLNVEEPVDVSKLNAVQRTELGDKKRERGNYYYGREEYTSAITLYTKALQILDDSHQSHSEEASELQQLLDTRIKCYNNLALAQYKVEAYEAALKSCDKVLRAQPDNVKALFRKGKCLSDKGDIDNAIIAFKKALSLEPQRKNIHQELSRLLSKKKAEDEKQKEMYRRMIGVEKTPTPPPPEKKTNWVSLVLLALLVAVLSVIYRIFTPTA